MKQVETISVSLEPRYVKILERVAKKAGSRSQALRRLLEDYERAERFEALDRAYREYYSDPRAARESAAWTQDLMAASSWLHEGSPRRKRGSKR